MRVVPLTPMLPLAIPINDDQSRWRLFLAFKAASIVLAKIRGDVSKHVQKTPLAIPLRSHGLPGITGLEVISPTPLCIDFTLLDRYDSTSQYRNLYHARLVTTNEGIYVKFTQRYSVELHKLCAEKGLAPKLLGFGRLPGGWYAVAMEKVDVVDVAELDPESFSTLDSWKGNIGGLVKDFHRMGLIHGDLRLPNFIFTKDGPPRMLLVDFDLGGRVGQVCFPRGELAEELRPLDGQVERLDRPITKDDDDRVLAGTFQRLDQLAAQRNLTSSPSCTGYHHFAELSCTVGINVPCD